MPDFVVEKVQNALNDDSKPLRGSRVHIMGVSYKRDIDDVRESPAIDIMLLLEQRGAHVSFSDPYVPSLRIDDRHWPAVEPGPAARDADCVVIITDHRLFDYAALEREARLIVDTRNAMKGISSPKIRRL